MSRGGRNPLDAIRGRILVLCFLGTLGCESGDELPCVDVTTDCEPAYEPVFSEIFAQTLQPTCGGDGTFCHARPAAKAGMVFEDPDAAYDLLLGNTDGRARVTPLDPSCSLVVRRIEAVDPGLAMPPGDPLAPAVRCAIVQWIADGAKR